MCVPVPFYHCFGMVMGNLGATSNGATIVIPAPAFDPAATLQAVQDERCTSLYGVPTMFIAELGLPDFAAYDLSSLRTGIMAGAAVPGRGDEAGRRRDEHGRGHDHVRHDRDLAGVDDDPPRATTSSAGCRRSARSCPTSRCRSSTRRPGSPVPRGTPGELCTRGYSVMLGYWDAPEQTADADRRRRLDAHRRPRRRWTTTATSPSSAGSRTWSSAAARTSTPRGRGVPLRPPRHRRRPGDRRARRRSTARS